jgi:hypothetical protein
LQEIESRLWSLFNWNCNLVNYLIVIKKKKSRRTKEETNGEKVDQKTEGLDGEARCHQS